MPAVHEAYPVDTTVRSQVSAAAPLAALAATPPHAASGFAAQSARLIMEALHTNAERAERHNALGNQLVQQGDLEAAAAAFLSAVTLKSDDANLWNNLGSVRHRQKNYAAAENDYRNALRYDADFAPALGNLAALLMETGREEEASLLTCRAFVLPPLEGKSNEMLGIAYYRLGRSADAAACYRAW
ncbi:MAG: tetratricopeptide repeat protein, partial [Betaproteobacteria bacterium]